MKKVITYGTYDLLHHGHINLLRRAKELGDYLIVGVTSDSFDIERGKLNVRNDLLERIEAIRHTGLADKIIIEDYIGQKIDDIQKYNIDIFAIGSDWINQFDYLNEFCRVVYLDRTDGISSTMLRQHNQKTYKLGIIGTGRIARKVISEVNYVSGLEVFSVLNPVDESEMLNFVDSFKIKEAHTSFESFIKTVDAVYIASPHLTHYEYTKKALLANKHVLCEIPFVLHKREAEELYQLATKRKLVLLEAYKTAHCPAFNRLIALVKSGEIGDVVDIRASLSKLVSGNLRELDFHQAGGSMTELSFLPLLSIIKLLGTKINDMHFFSKMRDNIDIFTKGIFVYHDAIASITLGLGVKTEGNLVISGTKGYIYVPAPWWKTESFEIRYEDTNLNKKFFYKYEEEGLRYEFRDFISMIDNQTLISYRLNRTESLAIIDIVEKYMTTTTTIII